MFLTDLLNFKAKMTILQNRPTLLNLILLMYLVMLILCPCTVLLFCLFEDKSVCIDCKQNPRVNLNSSVPEVYQLFVFKAHRHEAVFLKVAKWRELMSTELQSDITPELYL